MNSFLKVTSLVLLFLSAVSLTSADTRISGTRFTCRDGAVFKGRRELNESRLNRILDKLDNRLENIEELLEEVRSERRQRRLERKLSKIESSIDEIDECLDGGAADSDEEDESEDNSENGGSSEGGNSSDAKYSCGKKYTKQANVFGVRICATKAVSDENLLHAAAIMAEYLDNDENGEVDDKALNEFMRSIKSTLIMAKNENSLPEDAPSDTEYKQPLFNNEVEIDGAARGVFDASLEEVFHLISSNGLSLLYQKELGEEPGSDLTVAMDIARGGQFLKVPSTYPDGAWYTYDDKTCEYICMASEYLYWILTSWLGGQDLPGRLEEIEQEWPLNTRAKMEARDTAASALILSLQERGILPTILPDGVYKGGSFTILRR